MNLSKNKTIQILIKSSFILGSVLTLAFFIYGLSAGIFTSSTALNAFLNKFGIWGPIVFIFIQIVQVILPIIPGAIGCAVGVMIFGPLMGFIYNYIGICMGSCIAFFIARHYGMGLVASIVRQKTLNKYIGWLGKGKKYEKMFAAAIFLPVSPDDFLCYLSGLTTMSFKKFILIILLCKPGSIFIYSMGLVTAINFILKLTTN